MLRPLVGLVLLIAFVLAACGDGDGASPTPSPTPAPSAALSPSPTPTLVPSPVNPSHDQLSFLIDREFYLVKSDGSEKTALDQDARCHRFSRLTWSPDGTRVICAGADSTVLFDGGGTTLGEWTDVGGDVQWSPTSVAFALPTEGRIIVRDSDGVELADLGPADVAPGGMSVAGRSRLWSPAGNEIAYWNSAASELRAYSLDSGSERAVAGDYRPLAWLSDGNTIVAAAGYEPPVDVGFILYDVVLVDTSTGSISPVPELRATPDGPIRANLQLWFSPDTSLAAVLTTRPNGFPGLGVFDMQRRTLTPIPGSIITFGSDHIPQGNVQWSPDGRTLYWIDMGETSFLYKANADGSDLVELFDLPAGGVISPDVRSVAHVDFSADFSIARLLISEIDGSNPIEVDFRESPGGVNQNYRLAWRPVP
jgi:WD40 repeat protein